MARHRSSRRRRGASPVGSCRARHAYGPRQDIGAGIVRYVCVRCGAVSIDLSDADPPLAVGSLFEAPTGTLRRA